jgi:hypothetical protein
MGDRVLYTRPPARMDARLAGSPGARPLSGSSARAEAGWTSRSSWTFAPLIGEQAQVDWAHVGDVDVPGGRRKLWLFVMLLSWSRGLWGEFIFDLTVYSLLLSLARATRHFGFSATQPPLRGMISATQSEPREPDAHAASRGIRVVRRGARG